MADESTETIAVLRAAIARSELWNARRVTARLDALGEPRREWSRLASYSVVVAAFVWLVVAIWLRVEAL